MQPNYFYSSPHYPFNIQHTSPVAMNSSWSGDTSYSSTPVSVALYNTTATSSWAHTVPAFMPWVTESGGSSSTNVEQVMRFTAPFPPDPCTSQTATSWELFNNLGASKTNANLQLKRRNDLEDADAPRKQCITEDKMTARFQELHITNQYTPPPTSPITTQGTSENSTHKPTNKIKPITTLHELEALIQVDSGESSHKGSLVLAPELKSLVEPEKLFAKTLLTQVERPTMAVVLWKPPHGSVQDIRADSPQQSNYGAAINDFENNFVSSSTLVTETNNNSSISNIVHRASLGHSHSCSTSSSTLPAYPLASTNQEESDYIMEV